MNTHLTDIAISLMLLNFSIITGCCCIQCVEEFCERREKKRTRANNKDNGPLGKN